MNDTIRLAYLLAKYEHHVSQPIHDVHLFPHHPIQIQATIVGNDALIHHRHTPNQIQRFYPTLCNFAASYTMRLHLLTTMNHMLNYLDHMLQLQTLVTQTICHLGAYAYINSVTCILNPKFHTTLPMCERMLATWSIATLRFRVPKCIV